MSEEPAPIRLREAGVGVTVGGVVLIVLTQLLPPLGGAAATLLLGGLYMIVGPDLLEPKRFGTGMAIVGLIGLIETSPYGIGFEPLVVGLFAIAFGMFDIVIGLVFSRIQYRHERHE